MTDARAILKEWAEGVAGATPGPWAVNPVNALIDAFNEGFPIPVCAMLWPTDLRSEAETDANATLIANCSPDRIAAVLAHVEALEKALEPLARNAELFDPDEGDDNQLIWGPTSITIGDLRRARKLIGDRRP